MTEAGDSDFFILCCVVHQKKNISMGLSVREIVRFVGVVSCVQGRPMKSKRAGVGRVWGGYIARPISTCGLASPSPNTQTLTLNSQAPSQSQP